MSPPLLVQAVRLPFLTGSLMPIVIIAAWAALMGKMDWGYLILTLVGVGVVHLGGNVINDFFDAQGSDPVNERVTPFSGGSRVIQQGRLSTHAMFWLAMLLFAMGLAAGLWLVYLGRPWVLAVGTAGLLGAWLYSARPFSLMSRGLGEVVLFLSFGPVLTLGAGYVFSGQFTWQAFVLGLPTGWLITAVLWINQFPDYQADRQAGKDNLVVRMGTKRSRVVYAALMLAPYPTLLVMVHLAGFTPWLYLGWLTLPLALKAVTICWRNHEDHVALIPAQALTIITHLATAACLTAGFLVRYLTA